MINKCEIRNFRCFDKVDISGLKRFTFLVGASGSGKTAFLEALFLSGGTNAEIYFRVRRFRGLGEAAIELTGTRDSFEGLFRDMFHNFDQHTGIDITIHDSERGYRTLELKKEANKPAVFVVMLPFTPPETRNNGFFESLLFQTASANLQQYMPCVDQFCACVHSDAWIQRSHIDKLRLRILLSAACEDDPNLGLPYALNPAKNLIPLNHPSLDGLVAILRDTPALL